MTPSIESKFNHYYSLHCKHLKLKGLRPKTIDAYSRAIRRIGAYFEGHLDNLTQDQLVDYFHELLTNLSWSAVKLDLYGLKFFYTHVLHKPWIDVPMIKPPRCTRIPDIVTVAEAQQLFMSTRKLSYRVFYFTIYSMGLRLGEGLNLKVGDIDASRMQVHIRNAKGNKDRLVPLPLNTLRVLREFWSLHRHPTLMFPNRTRGLKGAHHAKSPLDRGGIQKTINLVTQEMGLKKRFPVTRYAIVTPLIC
ncbi:MAG: site-specific integrase [Methyloprofundus sp.]|nr:site-specific integrase [Methylococcales bacterium]MCK5354967.1 site-specific integrase [Methyloprofundus sp.]